MKDKMHGGAPGLAAKVRRAARRALRSGAARKAVALAMSAALVAGQILGALAPAAAFAADDTTITFPNGGKATLAADGTITGTVHVKPRKYIGGEGMNATQFDVTGPDGQTYTGYCYESWTYVSNHGLYPAPGEASYGFTATPNGDGTWQVIVHSEGSKVYAPWAGPSKYPCQKVVVPNWRFTINGRLRVVKSSSNNGVSDGNPLYSLAGAEYGVYSDAGCTKLVTTVKTGSDGAGTSGDIAAGSYWVKETKAPAGYALSLTVTPATVEGGKTATVSVSDAPQNDPVDALVLKVDADTGRAVPQGDADLSGAEYEVRFYAGYYDEKSLPDKATRSWTLRTDEGGWTGLLAADLDPDTYLAGGDEMYRSSAGKATLPLGTVAIRETKAPEGYLLTDTSWHVQQIKAEGTVERVSTLVVPDQSNPTTREEVKTGRIEVQKRDAESHAASPLGSGSFEDITFDITNISKRAVVVNGVSYPVNAVVETLVTDASGHAVSSDLPYGTYLVTETGHGRGYFGNADWSQTVRIREDGQVVDLTQAGTAVEDQAIRGDLSFSKKDGETGEAMAGVPFLVTSLTTGESHVIVTDENGMASTAADWNAHTANTNANDAAVTDNGDGTYTVDESRLDSSAGVWFGRYTADDGTVQTTDPNDGLGALPYDRTADGGGYTVVELPVSANEGHELVSLTKTPVSITRNAANLDWGTVDDQPVSIGTELTAEGGAHLAEAGKAVTLTDTVAYEGLVPGKAYTVSGELHLVGADGSDGGVVATAKQDFTAAESTGHAVVTFTFDAGELAGKRVVAFETVSSEGRTVAVHADITDEGQTVGFPEIHTTATSSDTAGHDAPAKKDLTIDDAVAYAGLTPGEEYALTGTLVDAATGKPVQGADGKAVTATSAFTPASPDGTAHVSFTFDASALAGHDLVAFERLADAEGNVIASHEDATDEGQTVHIPKIGTTAEAKGGGKMLPAKADQTVTDTISYKNLLPDTDYTATATLHIVRDGKDAGTLGGPVTATFHTPKAGEGERTVSGTATVEIPCDLTGLEGADVVAFESVSRGGVEVAAHADLTDESQTVHVPGIHTTATDKETGSHKGKTASKVTIVDNVEYKNLVPGEEYELVGTLYDKATGKPYLVDGKPVTTTVKLTPEKPDGTATVTFVFDGTGLDGVTLVAFEELRHGDNAVAVHADIDDAGQSVTYEKPEQPTQPGQPSTPSKGRSGLPQTGDEFPAAAVGAIALGGLTAVCLALALKGKRRGAPDEGGQGRAEE